jgi:hypothetical protein
MLLTVCASALNKLDKGVAMATAATNTGDKRILLIFLFTTYHTITKQLSS